MKLFIPIISQSSTTNIHYTVSMLQFLLFLKDNDISYVLSTITEQSFVKAKNIAISIFLSSIDLTHIIFIDPNIQFIVEDVMNLLYANKDVIGVICSNQSFSENKIDKILSNSSKFQNQNIFEYITNSTVDIKLTKQQIIEKPAIIESSQIDFNFVIIRKHVIVSLINNYSIKKYKTNIDIYNLFQETISDSEEYLSYDKHFCNLWKNIGGKIYIATNVSVKYYGFFGYKYNMYKQFNLLIN